jgi:hypothetical protein
MVYIVYIYGIYVCIEILCHNRLDIRHYKSLIPFSDLSVLSIMDYGRFPGDLLKIGIFQG